jgi:peptidoglycan/LPS O-acetylase OafA/YrhL
MEGEARRVGALDGLRGIAVAAVVVFHLGRLSGGWLGVDAFFTLSGYLITALLLAEAGRGAINVRRFWRRRIRRLQPAALVVIATIVATAPWWARPGTGRAVRGDALASLFSVANWHMLWSHQPYAAGGTPSAFEHFWSLAIEEQFYVVWPLVVVGVIALARRHTRVAVFTAATIGVAASWTLLATSDVQHGYLATGSRVGSILAGAALACAVRGIDQRRGSAVVGYVGLAGMVTMWFTAGWPPHAPLVLLLPLHTAFAIMAIVGAPALLRVRPLVTLGIVSYGIYLWHWPVIVILTPARLGQNELVTDIVRLSVIALLTIVSWNFIERPVRRERVLRATRMAYPVAATTAVAIVVFTAAAVAPAPVWARAKGELVQSRVPVALIRHRSPRRPRRVLVIGDSLPTSLLSGFDSSGHPLQIGQGRLLEQFAAAGITAASATITGCPVLDEAVYSHDAAQTWCAPLVQRVLTHALTTFRPDLVVWFDVADGYEISLPNGTRQDPMASAAGAAALRARYANRISWLTAQHTKVVFVSPGPVRDGHDDEDLRDDTYDSMQFLDQTLQAVRHAHSRAVVGVIEMSDLTCPAWRPTHHCADVLFGGGHFREADGMHYDNGAVVAGGWLVQRVAVLDLGSSQGNGGARR